MSGFAHLCMVTQDYSFIINSSYFTVSGIVLVTHFFPLVVLCLPFEKEDMVAYVTCKDPQAVSGRGSSVLVPKK